MSGKKTSVLAGVTFAATLFLALGCNKENSFSPDRNLSGQRPAPAPTTPGQPAAAYFPAVQAVLNNKCAECHDWVSNTESQWLTDEKVKPGDPDCSLLYNKLKGTDAHCATPLNVSHNMPKGGGPGLTIDELHVFRAWLSALGK